MLWPLVGAAKPQSHRVPERQSVGTESVRAAERRGGGVPERRGAMPSGRQAPECVGAVKRQSRPTWWGLWTTQCGGFWTEIPRDPGKQNEDPQDEAASELRSAKATVAGAQGGQSRRV